MKRIARVFLLVVLLAPLVHAVGPLAFLAKDLVKGIVRNFLEGQVNQMLATAGPCGLPLTGPGGGNLAGMLRGGGMPGVGSMPGAGSMRVPGAGGAAGMLGGGAMPGLGSIPGAGLPPGLSDMMKDQMAQSQATLAKEQAARGANTPDSESRGTPRAVPDIATALQALQGRPPLSSAELDELGTLMERLATAMPSAAPKCKPGELKAALQTASDSPMGGGVLRMVLGSLRDVQRQLDEARDTFAKMTEQDRIEYVELMAAEFRGWDKDSQQALLGMVETNFLGMPDAMKTQLLARLKRAS